MLVGRNDIMPLSIIWQRSIEIFSRCGQSLLNDSVASMTQNHTHNEMDSSPGCSHIAGDLPSTGIREALHHLSEITGQVTTDDLLENIFSKFCIGK